jgi:hypothetical protein
MMINHMVGVREISKLMSISRQRADQLVRTKGFPEPAAELAGGRVWSRQAVIRWARANGRSVPLATVEIELAQIPSDPGGPGNRYRAVYQMTRMQGLGTDPREVLPTRAFAHEHALKSAREVDPLFDIAMPRGHTQKSVPGGIASGIPQHCSACGLRLEYTDAPGGNLYLECPLFGDELELDGSEPLLGNDE